VKMKKKHLKMMIATNPHLQKWFLENQFWLQTRPEVMLYISQNPQVLQQIKPGVPLDEGKLSKNAEAYVNQLIEQKKKKKEKPAKDVANLKPAKPKKKGILANLKSKFASFTNPAAVSKQAKIPAIKPPQFAHKPMSPLHARGNQILPKPKARKTMSLPKVKLSRKKVMESMSQTVEMLDVVSALLGKVGTMK
jgi:hypothetical protein